MILEKKGVVEEGVYMLGHPVAPVYLVDGPSPVIIEAGLTLMTKMYAAEIKKVLGTRQPEYCFITHAHFDHLGAAAGLKHHFPDMRIAASPRVGIILDKPSAVERIRYLNRSANEMFQPSDVPMPYGAPFEPFEIDVVLSDGDMVRLSDSLTIEVMETPGHTRDMLSYYLPEKRMLFPSEALGIPHATDYIEVDCLVDYDMHLASMARLDALDTRAICLGHYGVYTDEDAAGYILKAVACFTEFFQMVRRFIHETGGDTDQVIHQVREHEYDPHPHPKQPEAAYLLNLRARIDAISRKVLQEK